MTTKITRVEDRKTGEVAYAIDAGGPQLLGPWYATRAEAEAALAAAVAALTDEIPESDPREYANLSDFLFDHAEQLREQYRGQPYAAYAPAYGQYGAELDFLLAVMEAVRMLPGLDGRLDANASDFDAVINVALRAYRVRVGLLR